MVDIQQRNPSDPSPPKLPRRLRFSLKALLVAMALFSLWLGYITHRARQQKQAVAAITEVGGRLSFAHQRMPNDKDGARSYDREIEPPVPRWIVNAVGVDYFRSVDSVSLVDAPVSDQWLAQLDKLPSLISLTLRRTNVTGPGVAQLRWLRNLEQLDIEGMHDVTDETLRSIGQCRRLEQLSLYNCPAITDVGLQYLAPLVKMEQLVLSNSQVTDAGVVHLAGMSKLRMLQLGGTHVTDESPALLGTLKELYWLDLRGTQVTDKGLRHLEGLTKLWQLALWDTQATQAGADRLEAKLPNLKLLAVGPEPITQAPSPFPPRRGRGRGTR